MKSPGSRQRAVPAEPVVTDAEAAVIAANGFILRHYSTSLMGGRPSRLPLPQDDLWVVPILLTSPGFGAVGEVGVVAVDTRTGRVVGGTPKEDVLAAVQRFREEKQDALEAAFRRARAT